MLYTPLEQFQIILLFSVKLFCFDFSITNLVLVNLLVLFFFFVVVTLFSSNANYLQETSFFFIPSIWQALVEIFYETSLHLLFDNINKDGEKYFPFISVIFTFVLFSNLIGLIPYSFTATSHLIVTFTLSFSIFIGINIICIQKHKFHMLSLFIPANTAFGLALLLVPIELLSYVFKPISLGVRLFANLMAGHTLLKVIVGFSWSMLLLEDFLAIFHIIPFNFNLVNGFRVRSSFNSSIRFHSGLKPMVRGDANASTRARNARIDTLHSVDLDSSTIPFQFTSSSGKTVLWAWIIFRMQLSDWNLTSLMIIAAKSNGIAPHSCLCLSKK